MCKINLIHIFEHTTQSPHNFIVCDRDRSDASGWVIFQIDRAKERTFKGKTDILIFRTDKLRIFNGEYSHQLLILTAIDINIDFQNLFESMFNT